MYIILRYEELLKESAAEDLTEISGIGFLYQSGFDRLGRPIIILCGKWFPANIANLDKVSKIKGIIYLIKIVNFYMIRLYFETFVGYFVYSSSIGQNRSE